MSSGCCQLSSWDSFTDWINVQLASNAAANEISDAIAGREIEWEGKLKQFRESKNLKCVRLAVAAKQIDAGGTEAFKIDTLSITTDGFEDEWRDVEAGCHVRFTARFAEKNSIFGAFQTETLPTGRVYLSLTLNSARLVEVVN